MTPRKAIRDVPASVRQRLLNVAREQGADFEPVLQRYAIERFLYRLSASDEVVYSDNQDENLPTIRMRESPPLALGGRA